MKDDTPACDAPQIVQELDPFAFEQYVTNAADQ